MSIALELSTFVTVAAEHGNRADNPAKGRRSVPPLKAAAATRAREEDDDDELRCQSADDGLATWQASLPAQRPGRADAPRKEQDAAADAGWDRAFSTAAGKPPPAETAIDASWDTAHALANTGRPASDAAIQASWDAAAIRAGIAVQTPETRAAAARQAAEDRYVAGIVLSG